VKHSYTRDVVVAQQRKSQKTEVNRAANQSHASESAALDAAIRLLESLRNQWATGVADGLVKWLDQRVRTALTSKIESETLFASPVRSRGAKLGKPNLASSSSHAR
jgi:hypothetical protein